MDSLQEICQRTVDPESAYEMTSHYVNLFECMGKPALKDDLISRISEKQSKRKTPIPALHLKKFIDNWFYGVQFRHYQDADEARDVYMGNIECLKLSPNEKNKRKIQTIVATYTDPLDLQRHLGAFVKEINGRNEEEPELPNPAQLRYSQRVKKGSTS